MAVALSAGSDDNQRPLVWQPTWSTPLRPTPVTHGPAGWSPLVLRPASRPVLHLRFDYIAFLRMTGGAMRSFASMPADHAATSRLPAAAFG